MSVVNKADQEYIKACQHILEHGVEKSDRTGTGTKSVFGVQMRFNLQDGFPLLTTKEVHWHSVVTELLWFLMGDTNIGYLRDNKVRIWNSWSVQNFSHLDDTRKGVWIPSRKREYTPYTGNFSTTTVEAFHGERLLKNQWRKMMLRCYDVNAHNYSNYGGKGISVCKEWHDCATFIKEVKTLPNWELKLNDYDSYELDKDYYGSNIYSKETCIWLHKSENSLYIGNPIQITYSDGECEIFHSFSELEKHTGLSSTTAHRWLKSGVPKTKKQGAKAYSNIVSIQNVFRENHVYRKETRLGEIGPMYGKQWREWEVEQWDDFGCAYTFWEDQIQTLIKSIKEDPDSRRHLVSAWNVSNLPDSKLSPQENVKLGRMALAPCHYSFQCYVADGKLSMLVNQRSADMFLGVPFNIASYSLLTHMIALVCDLEVGELIWSGGDCHLYLNHLDQIKEQIKRYEGGKMHPAPTLELNSNIKDIDLFTHEDIHIHNYKHEDKISAPVAV